MDDRSLILAEKFLQVGLNIVQKSFVINDSGTINFSETDFQNRSEAHPSVFPLYTELYAD
jgi:hypothetical protein